MFFHEIKIIQNIVHTLFYFYYTYNACLRNLYCISCDDPLLNTVITA